MILTREIHKLKEDLDGPLKAALRCFVHVLGRCVCCKKQTSPQLLEPRVFGLKRI